MISKVLKFTILLFYVFQTTYTQQDPHFTQYTYNPSSVNPAFAGTTKYSIISLIGRSQWVGFKGTPDSQTLNFESPTRWKNLGIGFNIINDKIGPYQEIIGACNTSYTIRLNRYSKLSFGLRTGLTMFNLNINKLKHHETLKLNVNNLKKKLYPNFGAGIYYKTKKYYLGMAMPNLINLDYATNKKHTHIFGTLGFSHELDNFKILEPSILIKIVSGAPISVDLALNYIINKKINTSISYRVKDAICASIGFKPSKDFTIGYAYDLTSSSYRYTNSGSHEIFLKYQYKKVRKRRKQRKIKKKIYRKTNSIKIKSKNKKRIATPNSTHKINGKIKQTIFKKSNSITVNNKDVKNTKKSTTKPIIDREKQGKQFIIKTIYFNFDKSDIRQQDSEPELNKIVKIMKKHPKLVIKIESHTDSRGDEAYNLTLSQNRADSTRKYIISQGINANRIKSAIGYGEKQLQNDCYDEKKCSDKQHQINRRSYFIAIKGGENIKVRNTPPIFID